MSGDAGFEQDIARLWLHLSLEAARRRARVIGFAGVHRSAGVTTLLGHIADASRAAGETVTLVDGNVEAPALHALFGAAASPGVGEMFQESGAADPPGLAAGPRIRIVPCGTWRNPLASTSPVSWREFFRRIARDREGENVLVDAGRAGSPTCLAIAAASDAVVLVAEAGRTRREQLSAVRDELERASIEILGVVLNKRRELVPSGIYDRL